MTLEDFELFRHKTGRGKASATPAITIAPPHLRLSKGARAALNTPEFVRFLTGTGGAATLAVVASDADDPNAYRVRDGFGAVSCKGLLNELARRGVQPGRYDAQVVGNALVANFSEARS